MIGAREGMHWGLFLVELIVGLNTSRYQKLKAACIIGDLNDVLLLEGVVNADEFPEEWR